jgi:ATP phosphoribosyltransferase regulatory subunit
MGPTTDQSSTIRRSQLPDGVQDRFLAEAVRRRKVEQALRDCFAGWGYAEVIPPVFEFYDNLAVGAGPRLQQAMYRFFDQRGRTLALRADFTPQMARIAATKLFDQPMPLRLCYLGSLFRAEEPQAGRQREFTQAGVELVGAGTAAADAEVVALAAAALTALGIDGFQINLGQIAFFRALTGDLPREAVEGIRDAVDQKNPGRLAEATSGLDGGRRALLARLPDLVGGPEVVDEARELAAGTGQAEEAGDALERLAQVHEGLRAWGVADRVVLDLGEVRGMDYYTGITFRGVAPGLGWPLVSGGRYDDLIAHFGRAMPAVGMGLSVGRALLLGAGGEVERPTVDVLVHSCTPAHAGDRAGCLALVGALRELGCRVEVDVLGLNDARLAAAARARGVARTLRCAGDTWWLVDEGGEREMTGEMVLREAKWWNGQGGAR